MANKNSMTNQLETILDDIIQGKDFDDKQIVAMDSETIQISTQEYRLVKDYRDGFQLDAFINRYQVFFERFDYIVGDWAHDMLRLRGFYQIGKRKVPRDQQIDFLDDYLKEYCNFGAAYFVLGKVEALEKFKQLKNKETVIKKIERKPPKQRPKQTHVSTPTKDNSSESNSTKPKNNRRKKPFKKNTNTGVKSNQPQKVTEKVSEKVANDKNFVIKKVKKN